MSGLTLKNLIKAYGAVQVVHGVDLNVAQGEFVVLVGPSGCGKSTTLRMIAGLESITDGDLSIGDRLVNRVAPKDRDVAMVFQNYALYPHLSVAENIAFGLRIRRTPRAEVMPQVEEVASILGLAPYLDRKPADLSGGQRQRVAMGRAIVRRPKVFLFDEPLSNLDAKLRTQMRAEIKKLHNRLGATSIYVTHDQVEAMTLADRIVVMNGGRIEQIGTPMELFQNPANLFVATFLGAPPMNQIKATLDIVSDGAFACFSDHRVALPPLGLTAADQGRAVVLGIRPEFVEATPTVAANTIPVAVELVETLGSEALIHAAVAGEPFVMKVDTLAGLGALEQIAGFTVAADRIKVFDAETEQAIRPEGVSA